MISNLLLFTFFLEFALLFFSDFLPKKNCQVKKNQNQKNMLAEGGGWGLIQVFKPKNSSN